jgi:hypothetical protein
MVRAKFMLTEVTEGYWNRNSKRLVFSPQYDTSIPEDLRFATATPSGRFEMQVDNPAALAQLELGKTYYFDISEAV